MLLTCIFKRVYWDFEKLGNLLKCKLLTEKLIFEAAVNYERGMVYMGLALESLGVREMLH